MNKDEQVAKRPAGAESVHQWPRQIEPLTDATRQEIVRVVEQSIERSYKLGMNCAERTLAPICLAFEKWSGLPPDIVRMSSGFGGGGANTSYGLCGAVAGGLMALGIFWGRVNPIDSLRAVGLTSIGEAAKDPIRRDEYSRIFNCYMKEFNNSFGALICRDLIKKYLDSRGFYIPDPELQKERTILCKSFTTWAASRVAELILEGQEKGVQHFKMGHNKWNMP